MTEYTSKQVQILRADSQIYEALCDFNNFTPFLQDKVEGWQVDGDCCSFKAKGMFLKLRMIEKEPYSIIKITGEDMPFEFFFWVQLKRVDAYDTRLRLVIKAKLNMMMKMMVGKKLQQGLDQLVEQLAAGMNAR